MWDAGTCKAPPPHPHPAQAWLTAGSRVWQHHMRVQLLQLLVQQVKAAGGATQQQLHRAQAAAQVGGGAAQVLGALLQLQLLADLPAQAFPLQLQLLLHTRGRQVGPGQAQLLQQGPAAGLTLKGMGGRGGHETL